MIRRYQLLPLLLLASALGMSSTACQQDDLDDTASTEEAAGTPDSSTPEQSETDDESVAKDATGDEDAGVSVPPTAKPKPDAGSPADAAPQEQDDDHDINSLPKPQVAPTTPATGPTSGELEAVMVETKYVVGPGGGLAIDMKPVILFTDGTACRDINYLARNEDVATHRMKYPNAWTRWQVIDGKVALQNGSRWIYLDFQINYPPLARGYTLNDVYRHLGGGGNTAFGGDVLIVTEATYQLNAHHRFIQGSFAGVLSDSITAINAPADQQGTYEIEGYRITLRYDSGKTVTTSFVYNERDAGLIFLNGVSFVSSSS